MTEHYETDAEAYERMRAEAIREAEAEGPGVEEAAIEAAEKLRRYAEGIS